MSVELHKRQGYLPPKVPGMGPTGPRRGLDLTAPGSGSLKPSIGVDRWRTSDEQPAPEFTGGSCFKARPHTGKGDDARASAGEIRAMAVDEAAKIAATRLEDEMVRSARAVQAMRGAERAEGLRIARLGVDHLRHLSTDRAARIADLISEALNLG